jgi:hypothetical protein
MSDEKITVLHKQPVQSDIVTGLRNLADKIEKGEIEDMPVITTCVLMLGHTSDRLLDNGDMARGSTYDLYSWGPRCDAFTVRGLMATCLNLNLNG